MIWQMDQIQSMQPDFLSNNSTSIFLIVSRINPAGTSGPTRSTTAHHHRHARKVSALALQRLSIFRLNFSRRVIWSSVFTELLTAMRSEHRLTQHLINFKCPSYGLMNSCRIRSRLGRESSSDKSV